MKMIIILEKKKYEKKDQYFDDENKNWKRKQQTTYCVSQGFNTIYLILREIDEIFFLKSNVNILPKLRRKNEFVDNNGEIPNSF